MHAMQAQRSVVDPAPSQPQHGEAELTRASRQLFAMAFQGYGGLQLKVLKLI
jgi:hypothetical protein